MSAPGVCLRQSHYDSTPAFQSSWGDEAVEVGGEDGRGVARAHLDSFR
jgi:hypothetical protein